MSAPVAVVGMDFREGPTSVRAALKQLDDGPESPSQRLRRGGQCTGLVRIESCSRLEWVVSGKEPAWAGELLRGALLRGLGEVARGRHLHLKVSRAGLHYLVRLTLGLESVAEGEHAVGRQVLRAFEAAHDAGTTDRALHLCWRLLGRLLQSRRIAGVGTSVGVQSLAVAELEGVPRDAPVRVLGLGEIGGKVMRALQRAGFTDVQGHRRAGLGEFLEAARSAAAVVVCTGGPSPWVHLPPREGAPLAVDVGAPVQVDAAPGWRLLTLDELLARPGLFLPAQSQAELSAIAEDGAQALESALDSAHHHHLLEALESERQRYFEGEVEALVADLPRQEARRLTESLRALAHRLLVATRRSTRAS